MGDWFWFVAVNEVVDAIFNNLEDAKDYRIARAEDFEGGYVKIEIKSCLYGEPIYNAVTLLNLK